MVILPLTYEPKIQAVYSGACTQTIRQGHRLRPGDPLLIHTWVHRDCGGLLVVNAASPKVHCQKCGIVGSPYKIGLWGKRLNVTLTSCLYMVLYDKYIEVRQRHVIHQSAVSIIPSLRMEWTSPWADNLAAQDGIDPRTGIALRDLLAGMYKGWEGSYTAISWPGEKIDG